MALAQLPTELFYKIVRRVRRDAKQITLPGLVADARNRRVSKLFRAASMDIPAEAFDALFEFDTVEGVRLPKVVRPNRGRAYSTGGVYYRSAKCPTMGLLIARQPATGRVYVMAVSDSFRVSPKHHLMRSSAETDLVAWCKHDMPAKWTPDAAQNGWLEPRCPNLLVSAVLNVREFVLTFCGKNANYDYNLEHFDRLVFHPKPMSRQTWRGGESPFEPGSAPLPFVNVDLVAYETRAEFDRCIVADLARYNLNNTWKPGLDWAGSSAPQPYSHQGSRVEMSANVRFATNRFDESTSNPVATRSFLSREIALRLVVPEDQPRSAEFSKAYPSTDCMILNRHDRERGPADSVPSLSKLCGFHDEPKHAECCGWYVNLDSHGLSTAVLKMTVGTPRRNDMESYRRRLAEYAYSRAERIEAARTAIVAAPTTATSATSATSATPGADARAWKRDAAKRAHLETRATVQTENKTYSTGELKKQEQDPDDSEPENDAQFAADNAEEEPMFDSDDEWVDSRDNERRSRTERLAERRKEAVDEMKRRDRANLAMLLPSDDEDDL